MEEPNFPQETIDLYLKVKNGTATEEENSFFEAKKEIQCVPPEYYLELLEKQVQAEKFK